MLARLQRLEARAEAGMARDAWERKQELEQFNHAAERYIRAAREYLHERQEDEVFVPCQDEREILQGTNQLTGYYLRCLRQGAREGSNRSLSGGDAQESSGETRSAFGWHRR